MHRIECSNFNNIDSFKVSMALVVVAIHTLPTTVFPRGVGLVVQAIYTIAVPFFFVASGFLLWYKVWNATKQEKLVRIRKWLSKTLRLYVVWSMIYLPYAIYGFMFDHLSPAKAVVVYARNILLVGQNFWSWPLWYLLGMLVAGVIIYLMVRLDFKARTMYVIAALFALIGVVINQMHDIGYIDIYYRLFQTTRNGFFEGLPYIMIGVAIASHGVCNKNILWLLLIASFIVHMLGVKLATFVVIYALFSLVLQFDIKPRQDNLYKNFRLTSTIVYFVHMLWVGLLTILYPGLNPYWMFVATVALSFATAYLVIRNKETAVVKFCFR